MMNDDDQLSYMIRVGRKVGNSTPSYPGFTPIVVLTKSSQYGDLSPYTLKDEQGRIMENIYQYQKIYKSVPESTQRYSQWDQTIIWNWQAEEHVNTEGYPTEAYWKWRNAGFHNPYPVRYPVGYKHRSECLCSISEAGEILGYVEARKKIYFSVYVDLVKRQPRFNSLKERLKCGENLLIIEVDGPHQESLGYYKDKYNVKDDFITTSTVLVSNENMDIMVNDTKHPFGHGYCLGMALLDMQV